MVQATKLPVDTSADATQLAQTMFGEGVTLVSATYTGDPLSKGIYTDGNAVSPGVVPSDSGIILSTGHADSFTNATGSSNANQITNTGSNTSGPNGNTTLNGIAGAQTNDAAILDATFIPQGPVLTMQLVFSSEEYPEYVNGGFNDAVGVFVNGQRAELTIGSGNISIDNITDGGSKGGTPSNENLYVDNTGSQYNTEMDGFTVTLTLKAPVNPGVENTIWIGIADAGDSSYDSNLMIVADSLQTAVIANDDYAQMGPGRTRDINVLANDTALKGATLTITQINGQNVVAGDSVTLVSGTVVTVNADGTLTFDTSNSLGTETISYQIADGTGTTDTGFVTVEVACFTRGTLIETPRGPVAIEDLRAGDLVLTRDRGAQPLRWTGSTRVDAATLAEMPRLRPIRIRAGALGQGAPAQDLLVSPQHRILVRSKIAQRMFGAPEVLVAAKQLVLLDGIDAAEDLAGVEYYHLLFDRHEVVISNGAQTESLYTGPQALRSVGPAARQEILDLFPQLLDDSFAAEPARPLPSGREARKLAMRQAQQRRALLC
ncbi:Hint domain-containing protein [Paracoccus chinensis]|uniref:Hint domain-containing protein n=1 Tax=Paracoccus chinensis TaxID=525640 RepID=A0A1G9LJK9_9RHOB|nr:Hint domain-containing protein [Paracoccus chinensis]SDL62064.1 Hint domain-containing protein [Paracoccus chinensis]